MLKMSSAEKRLDIIIYGATGFTGRYTVEEMTKLAAEKPSLTWGISGRNKTKLEDLIKEISEKTGKDLSNLPVVVANNDDEDSLCEMAAKARVIVNCVGPYRFYGEPVIKACIASGTHHVDVSGEPQYMERMQLEYHEASKAKGIYIVSACGFDSIPADLGVVFFSQKFGGEVNSVETYLSSKCDVPNKILEISYSSDIKGEDPIKLSSLHNSNIANGWCLPFLGSDRSVVYRTQRYLYEHEKKRPVQMQAYVRIGSLWSSFMVIFVALMFSVLTKFKMGRKMLLKYPRFFSGGFISHDGPTEEVMKATHFQMTFNLEGWKEPLAEVTDNHAAAPDKRMLAQVKGTNPGYGATCVALLLSGLTILDESDKMPDKGGVYPPGAAFAKTSLVERLMKNGMTFEVIKEELA
ncbi:hypothetical protein J437_LFUL018699 [Ladona fulva]|uniref:Saccharopine dehydrogenase NADP binding domain-containing protein n=1 Tax=Ladona fulva TaxID=123851 RepID=A0A8K0KR57_LADFU|nr:hypothetical protein J437_LFUL018699 [Ladona fulva]